MLINTVESKMCLGKNCSNEFHVHTQLKALLGHTEETLADHLRGLYSCSPKKRRGLGGIRLTDLVSPRVLSSFENSKSCAGGVAVSAGDGSTNVGTADRRGRSSFQNP